MRGRNVWIAAAVVVLIAIVIVVGLQQQQSAVANGSLSPTVSARTTASPTTAATARLG